MQQRGIIMTNNEKMKKLEKEIKFLKIQIEELEEELQEAKDNYDCLEWHNDNQYQLLIEYKNIIVILKKRLGIQVFKYIPENEAIYQVECANKVSKLNEEDYELLKGRFGEFY